MILSIFEIEKFHVGKKYTNQANIYVTKKVDKTLFANKQPKKAPKTHVVKISTWVVGSKNLVIAPVNESL